MMQRKKKMRNDSEQIPKRNFELSICLSLHTAYNPTEYYLQARIAKLNNREWPDKKECYKNIFK